MKSIGDRIRTAREALKLSQEEVASKSHMGTRNLQRLEGGDGNPTLSTLLELSSTLSVSIDWLARGEASSSKPARSNPSLSDVMDQLTTILARLPSPDFSHSLDKQIQALEDEVAQLTAINMVNRDRAKGAKVARKPKKKSATNF